MKSRLVAVVVAVLGIWASAQSGIAEGAVAAPAQPSCRVALPSHASASVEPDRVVVVGRHGHGRVAGAYVVVRLMPYGAHAVSRPPVVARGFADERGVFGFDLARRKVARTMGARAAHHVVNLQFTALDGGRRVAIANDAVPVYHPYRVRLALRYAVPSAARVAPDAAARTIVRNDAVDTDLALRAAAASYSNGYTRHTANATRWVAMAALHSSAGTNVTFTMAKGRDTKVQEAFSYDGGAWSAHGFVEESTSRESTHSRTFKGTFNHVMRAQYVFHKYHHYEVDCIPCGACSQWTSDRWDPYSWTGGIDYASAAASRPSSMPRSHIGLARSNDSFATSSAHNVRFGAGVSLAGLSLDAETGYSTRTSIDWQANGRCGRNYLAGSGGKYPVNAAVIYAYSSRC